MSWLDLSCLDEDEREQCLTLAKKYLRYRRGASWDIDDLIQAGVIGILRARQAGHAGRAEHLKACHFESRREMWRLRKSALVVTYHKDAPKDVVFQAPLKIMGDPVERPQIDWEANREHEERVAAAIEPIGETPRKAVCQYFGALGHPREQSRNCEVDALHWIGVLKSIAAGEAYMRKVHGSIIDRQGQRFGRLTVESLAEQRRPKSAYWLCRCDCGGSSVVESSKLKHAKYCSSGCRLLKEAISERDKKRAAKKASQSA